MKKGNETDLITFKHEIFGDMDIYYNEDNGKFYFPASDVAERLGYKNPRKAIRDHCKEDGVTMRSVIDSLGRKQLKKYIHEGNLYRLITRSELPESEEFEKWVFDEVIPNIRQDGMYIGDNATNEQKLFHYKMLGLTFMNYDIGKLKELYNQCIDYYSNVRLPYFRKVKGKRRDTKHSNADTKIMVMKKIKETLEQRETEHRIKGEFAHVALITDVLKLAIEDIKTIQHNKTRGKLAATTKLITE